MTRPDQPPQAGAHEQPGRELRANVFEERLRGQREAVDEILATAEEWTWPSGDYTGATDFTIDPWEVKKPDVEAIMARNIDPSGLGEHERLIDSVLSRQLSEATERPVIALDVGGGKGVTWARLAEHHRDEVAAGKILFVVSNLTASGRKDTVDRAGSGYNLSDDTLQLLDRAEEQGLVQFVSGPFPELPDSEIVLPDGRSLPLDGNVTFLHESRSTTLWSKVPEVDIPRVAEVLAPEGVYMVRELDTRNPENSFSLVGERQARLAGIQIAHRILRERGLNMQTTARLGDQAGQELCWLVFSNAERPIVVA